jgi:hypothetical protein
LLASLATMLVSLAKQAAASLAKEKELLASLFFYFLLAKQVIKK